MDLELHEAFVQACQGFQDAKEAKDAAEKDLEELNKTKGPGGASAAAKNEAQEMLNVWKTVMNNALTAGVKAAQPILETISLKDHDLEMSLFQTALLSCATPKGMTQFADESDMNGQLIETLMNLKIS